MINKEEVIEMFKDIKDVNRGEGKKIYDENIFPKVVEAFRKAEKGLNVLVLTVGLSYEPIVLSLKYFHPKKAVLIYTERSYKISHSKIEEYAKQLNVELEPPRIVELGKEKEIFKIIKEVYERNNKDSSSMIIDFTGGTKTMPAISAIAAHYLKIKCAYVKSELDPDIKKPRPFSEEVVLFDAPLEEYTKFFSEDFVKDINDYNFKSALDKLKAIKDSSKANLPILMYLIDIGEHLTNLGTANFSLSRRFHQFVNEGKYKISEDDFYVEMSRVLKRLFKYKHEGKEVEFETLRDLLISYIELTKQNFMVSLIYMERVIEHIRNKIFGEEGYDPINFVFDGNMADFKKLFKDMRKEDYKRDSIPKKIPVVDSLVFLKLRGYKFDYDLLINKIIANRNILVHGENLNKVMRLNKDMMKYFFTYILTLYNKYFKNDFEEEEFKELLCIHEK